MQTGRPTPKDIPIKNEITTFTIKISLYSNTNSDEKTPKKIHKVNACNRFLVLFIVIEHTIAETAAPEKFVSHIKVLTE